MVPTGVDAIAGVTRMLISAAADTVTAARPATVPEVAVMVAVPTARPVTVPAVPAALETDAVAIADVVQVTLDVRSTVLLSE